MKKEEKEKAIKLISEKFAFVEDLLEELSDNEIKRLNDNAEAGEYEND